MHMRTTLSLDDELLAEAEASVVTLVDSSVCIDHWRHAAERLRVYAGPET